MRWHRSLVLIALVAGRAPAQDVREAANPPAPPMSSAVRPVYTPAVIAGPADRLAGSHLFPDIINWMSNPAYNVDLRGGTAMYPIFQSSWAQNTAP